MPLKSSELTTHRTLAGYFKEEVDAAIEEQELEASDEVGFYLVNLLSAFTKTDTIRLSLDEPFAFLLSRAVFSDGTQRFRAYRRLGDISLYLAGLFAPCLRRRAVDVDYAIRMGSGAYSAVASLSRGGARTRAKAIQPMYIELSDKFPALVEVLTQVCERTSLGADEPDLAELYERWNRTKGPHLSRRMQALGVLPVSGQNQN